MNISPDEKNQQSTFHWQSSLLNVSVLMLGLLLGMYMRDLTGGNDPYVTKMIIRRLEEVEHNLKKVAPRQERAAFMAGIKPDVIGTKIQIYRGGDDMIFNHVITNVGGWYKRNTGKFVCRKTGVYQFSVSIRASDPDHMAWAEIVNNGNVFGRVHVNRLPRRDDLVQDLGLTGSSVFYHECNEMDEIWVRAGSWENFKDEIGFFVGLSDEAYTSFSGMLISELH